MTTYNTPESAWRALTDAGYSYSGDYWRKPSRVDAAAGGYPRLALATVRRHDPYGGEPAYYTITHI